MPVYPNYHTSNNTDEGRAVIRDMEENWKAHSSQNLYFQGQGDIDTRFYVGDQQVFNDVYGPNMPFNYSNKIASVNLIKRLVEMPVGYQLEHRRSIITTPVEGGDQETSDQFTKLLMWNDRNAKIPQAFSKAFKGACIAGLNWVSAYLDYTDDPVNGDIRVTTDAYNEVIFDPFFKNLDMSDCNFWWKRSYLSRDQALVLLPGHEDLVHDMNPRTMADQDGKFQYTPQSIFYSSSKKFTYDEYWYRSYRTSRKLVNAQDGKQFDWKGSESDLREYLQKIRQQDPEGAESIKVVETNIPTVKRAIVLNGVLVEESCNPYGLDCYPTVPVIAYYTPESSSLENRIKGIVRDSRGPQFLFNKFLLSTMDQIDAQFSGYIAVEHSVTNPKSLHKTGPGQVVWRRKGTSPDDVQKIEPPTPSPATQTLAELLQKLMIDASATNETNYGLNDDKVAGVLNMLNQRAGMTSLNSLFDNLDNAMQHFGNIRIQMMQNNWTPAKVERIISEPASRQFYERTFGKYDIVIEDGYDTSTQRQLAFAQALKMKEIMGDSLPNSFLMAKSTLQDKNEMTQMIQQQEQQQAQAQQAQAQVAMQEQQATIDFTQASAEYQKAGGRERDSRILENAALANERVAGAAKDREEGTLSFIKALKELQDLSTDVREMKELLSLRRELITDERQRYAENLQVQSQIGEQQQESLQQQPVQQEIPQEPQAAQSPAGELEQQTGL